MSQSKRDRLQNLILPLLRCPQCRKGGCSLAGDTLVCDVCAASHPIHNNIPIFTAAPEGARDFAPEVVVENHYSEQWQELLTRAGDGYVLDLGSGNNPDAHEKLIKLDIFTLPNVDIVAVAENLPFRDGIFRAVMSGAVFEHVQDPFQSIAEVRRVLEDGGDVYIETAFLQPVHAFPSHYFNMTRMGLEYVCRAFKRLDSGTQPHQYPSFALCWFLDVFARKLPRAARRNLLKTTVGEILDEFQTDPFSKRWISHFSQRDLEALACGVYFYGRKTDEEPPPVAALPYTTPPPPRRRLARMLINIVRKLRRIV